MLILTRKVNESIQIGDSCTITVIEISRGKVRLGIEAPRDIPVVRTEVAARTLTDPDPKP